jgi:2-(1,2-epoxy-1,2-dihydrophenyl)acetyl-CoA isomerase
LSYSNITYEVQSHVAIISLNRPERLNAITPAMCIELQDSLGRCLGDGARSLLLRAEGQSFCAGADLTDGSGGFPNDLGALLRQHYNPLVCAFADLPIPVVTSIQGAAAGAGCSLALLGDIVVAARSAYLLLAFVNVGLVPDAGSTWLVANAIGRARALQMMLLGDRIPAEQACDWGLINSVVDDVDLRPAGESLAQRLAAGPTIAQGLIRRSVAAAAHLSLDDVLALELENQRRAGRTKDFQEGLAAFREKRTPAFHGI